MMGSFDNAILTHLDQDPDEVLPSLGICHW